jgi:predicted tellurium resistance membrane protein TerC
MPETPGTASGHPEVHSITDAAAAHSEDMRERMIKYALAMGIRMVCLILIFVVDGWFKLVAVAGAVFLPWIAVVIANGSDKAEVHSDSLLDYTPYAELEASEELQSADAGEDVPAVLQGELISDEDDEGREQKAS